MGTLEEYLLLSNMLGAKKKLQAYLRKPNEDVYEPVIYWLGKGELYSWEDVSKLYLEGPGLGGSAAAAAGGTQSKLGVKFVVQCLLSRFSLVYDIQSQKEKGSTYL